MKINLLLINLFQSSLFFIPVAIILILLMRSRLKAIISPTSFLLLWVFAFAITLLPGRINIKVDVERSPFTRILLSEWNPIDIQRFIDWGILEFDSPGDTQANKNRTTEALDNAPKPSVFPILVAIWVIGLVITSTFYLFQHLHLRKLIRGAKLLQENDILKLCLHLCEDLKIRNPPGFRISDSVETAAVVGLFTPTVLLSPAILHCHQDQLRTILLHELTHYQKGHLWINALGLLSTVMHWFNPMIWIGYRELRRSIELACDEAVIRFTRHENAAHDYAHHLLDLMSQFNSLPSHRLSFLGLFNNLETRFIQQRILMINNTSKPKLPYLLVLLIGLSCTASAVTQFTAGQDVLPPPPPPPSKGGDSETKEYPRIEEAHIDQLDLSFTSLEDDMEFSDGAKAFLKESIIPILESHDPFPAVKLMLESDYVEEPAIQFLLGNLYLQKSMLAEAEACYINAVNKVGSKSRRAFFNLIMVYCTSGLYDEVYPLIRKYLELVPDAQGKTYVLAGVGAMQSKKYEEARDYFIKGRELEPDNKDAALNLFQAYLFLDDYSKANETILEIIENCKEDEKLAKYYQFAAKAALGLGDEKLAYERYKKSQELDPTQDDLNQIIKGLETSHPEFAG